MIRFEFELKKLNLEMSPTNYIWNQNIPLKPQEYVYFSLNGIMAKRAKKELANLAKKLHANLLFLSTVRTVGPQPLLTLYR